MFYHTPKKERLHHEVALFERAGHKEHRLIPMYHYSTKHTSAEANLYHNLQLMAERAESHGLLRITFDSVVDNVSHEKLSTYLYLIIT